MKIKYHVNYPECLNEEAKTLDRYIFDYFNNAYPDECAGVIKEWKELQAIKGESTTPKGEKEQGE